MIAIKTERRWIWRYRRACWSTVVRTARRTEIWPAPTKAAAEQFTFEVQTLFQKRG